jgi:hypothetical protein
MESDAAYIGAACGHEARATAAMAATAASSGRSVFSKGMEGYSGGNANSPGFVRAATRLLLIARNNA